ncbi:MAG: response regulator [Patescibacteria group bacterium]
MELESKGLALVVDDDEMIRESTKILLELKTVNYQVVMANDGSEALVKISELAEKREKLNLLFTDLRMPGKNGLEVARFAKSKYPYVKIIIASGNATPEDVKEAEEIGIVAFLQKPIDVKSFLEFVRKL